MANTKSGPEDIHRPFKKRRHAPGTSAGQYQVGYSAASLAMSQAKSLAEAARIAINKFGVPRRIVNMVLADPKRNNVKLMRLVLLSKKYEFRRRERRDAAVARVPGGKRGAKAFSQALETLDRARVARRVQDHGRGSEPSPD